MGKKVKHTRKEVDESNRPKGFVTVNKDLFWWFDNHFKSNRHEFSREEAMLWLLFNANYKKDNGIEAGELKHSIKFFQNAFGWKNRSRVTDFFDALVVEGTITRVGGDGDNWHIRIENWSKNQKKSTTPLTTPLTTVGTTPVTTPNLLINTEVTESCTTPLTTVGTTPVTTVGTHDYNNIDSSANASSSNYYKEKNKEEKANTPSLPLGGPGGSDQFSGFLENNSVDNVPFSLKDITDLILKKGYKIDSLLEKIISDSYQKAKERSFVYKDGLEITIDNLSERMIYLYKTQSEQNPDGPHSFSEKQNDRGFNEPKDIHELYFDKNN